jgi:hypothetical protein
VVLLARPQPVARSESHLLLCLDLNPQITSIARLNHILYQNKVSRVLVDSE